MKMNTRIAPSPTGDLHLGTARTAYFNYLAARATGGQFLLRIDDTDLQRSDDKFMQPILDTMDWLGLDYDQLAYQSKRFSRYHEIAQSLIISGKAKRDNNAVILIPDEFPLNGFDVEVECPVSVWTDDIAGDVVISEDDKNCMRSGVVLIKSDGSPTYHFASVVDDIDYNINFVIRGVDHITNTSRQVAIYTALGKTLPRYAHIGLLHKDGKKLSKRDGAASMLWYRDQGYDADAMLNFMARLGWGPKIDDKSTSLLPKDRMIQMFLNDGTMKSSSANIDLAKLDSFDRKYKARKKQVSQ